MSRDVKYIGYPELDIVQSIFKCRAFSFGDKLRHMFSSERTSSSAYKYGVARFDGHDNSLGGGISVRGSVALRYRAKPRTNANRLVQVAG